MWSLVLSRQGDPPGSFVDRRQIDSGQIKIGRSAATCDWAIPDQSGFLSREHCVVSAIGLDLFVTDTSTNGVSLNDPNARVLPQSPVAIRIGDRLLIGDYVISIASESAGLGAQIDVQFGQAPAPAPAFVQPDNWFDAAGQADPIWGGGGASQQEVHEFLGNAMHDFLAPPGGAGGDGWGEPLGGALQEAFSRPILAAPSPGNAASFAIPEDWAAPAMPSAAPAAAVSPVAAPAADPFGFAASDPFGIPSSPAAGTPKKDDPFASFFTPEAGGSPPKSFGEVDPFADFDMPPKAPLARHEETAIPTSRPDADEAFRTATAAISMAAAPSAPVSQAIAAPAEIDPEPGWAAFCEGAGMDAEALRRAPDAMRRLGVLYRQVVLGLSDMIQDRAAFKDEFRVERTQLSMGRNNPLKHLPALDSAKLLLADPLPGFLGSEEAVRLALEDIKKHQLAMLAGVQASLKAVFDRLAPAEVERLMTQAAAKRRGFGFGRGIDPWSVYQTLFEALRADATSNRNSVMSVAFREGYEAFLKEHK